MKVSTEGYAAIRRGIVDHARIETPFRERLTHTQFAVFVIFRLITMNTGEDSGLIRGTTEELAEITGCHSKRTLRRVLNKLCQRGYLVELEKGLNQHVESVYKIQKFDDPARTNQAFRSDKSSMDKSSMDTGVQAQGSIVQAQGSIVQAPSVSDSKHSGLHALKGMKGMKGGKRESSPDKSSTEPVSLQDHIDEKAILQAIVEGYPKKTKVVMATSALRDVIAKGADLKIWLPRVLAAASVCSRFPISEQAYLPSLPDFISGDWEGGWEAELQLVIANVKAKGGDVGPVTTTIDGEDEDDRNERLSKAKSWKTL